MNRKDEDIAKLRALILEGANSPRAGLADAAYFNQLRDRVSVMLSSRSAAKDSPPESEQ